MSLPALKFVPSPNFRQGRNGQRLSLIVVHRCEGSGPGTVAYFQTREADVSAHFVIGEKGGWITQMVHLADTAWHAVSFNGVSVGIEPAGYSKDGFDPDLLNTLAELVAYLCHYLQIPVRHARGGVGPGIESHWGLGKEGGGHQDPSTDPNWSPGVFLPLVQAAYDKADFNPNWLHSVDDGPTPCRLTPPAAPGAPALDLDSTYGVLAALEALGEPNPVKLFQVAHKLDADGDPGPATKAAILKALSGG